MHRLHVTISFSVLLILLSSCSEKLLMDDKPSTSVPAPYAINVNTASVDELQRIPHIGEKLAAKIVEHREVNGPFRRVEHLMHIQGISDKRFRKIRTLVRVE